MRHLNICRQAVRLVPKGFLERDNSLLHTLPCRSRVTLLVQKSCKEEMLEIVSMSDREPCS